jgi:hypothetical protein
MSPQDASYSERYCAFIDILGFRGLIDDLDNGKISVAEVYRVLSAVHSKKVPERQQHADLKHQSISDAVALSAAPNAAGLDAICTAAEELSRMLLRSGYFHRGGITKGNLYHDHSMVFGPALVEAYRLESKVAKYPRILIPRSVASDGTLYGRQGTHWREHFDARFIQAADGPFFLNIFRDQSRKARALAGKKPGAAATDDPQLILLKPMRTAVQKRYDEASDNPEHFEKVAWFVQYWNTMFEHGISGLEAITTRPL